MREICEAQPELRSGNRADAMTTGYSASVAISSRYKNHSRW
jgi:hypothetical protein